MKMSTQIPVTPSKIQSVNELQYSPITLPKSPAAEAQQRNLTGLPRVVRDIAADLYNNIQKWNVKHIRGAQIIHQVALLKADAVAKYPEGLELSMKDLYEVVQNLKIYASALEFLASQMNALVKLHKKIMPVFISLNLEQLAQILEDISVAYKSEMKAKLYILENVAFSKTKFEVMYFATSWTNPVNITVTVNLKVETILTETGHRKIT